MDTLKRIIKSIFEAVFAPILKKFITDIFWEIVDLLKDVFGWVFYEIQSILLRCVDFLESVFEFFAGTSKGTVSYNNGQQHATGTVLEIFLGLDQIQKIFLVITFVAILLSLIFTIVAVIRSMSDMTLDDKNPVSKVLKSTLKSVIMFMLVPFFCIFTLRLSGVVMTGIDTALLNSGTENLSVSDVIWLASSADAGSEETRMQYVGSGYKTYGKYDYKTAEKDFELGKFDYGLGITTAAVTSLILAMSMLMFIRRIFEILVLYLVAPFFVATMPLDEGEMFKKWKDMFIAKFFSGFGGIVAMRLYLLLAPLIADKRLSLYPSNPKIDTIIRLIFIIGGAFAMYGAQPMVMRMINYEAGSAETSSMGAVGGVLNSVKGIAMGAGAAFSRSMSGKNNAPGGGNGGGAGNSPVASSKDSSNANQALNNARLHENGQI